MIALDMICMLDEKEISFVAKYYRKGSFSVDRAWTSIGVGAPSKWRRFRAAAAVAAIVVLSATAAVIYNKYEHNYRQPEIVTESDLLSPTEVVRVIDFDEAALPVVVDKIKEVYGVKVTNLPENAETYILSLRYEGTAEDLVLTINEILDTDITIEE